MGRIVRLCHVVAAIGVLAASACKQPEPSATLASVSVAPQTPTMESGQMLQFTATAHYSDGTSTALTSGVAWTSARPAVASIDADGLAHGVATATDTTVITGAFQGKSGSATLTVTYDLKLIAIAGPPAALPAGFDARLALASTWSGNVVLPVTSGVSWETLDEGIATVSADGLVHGVATGTTTITAAWGGKSATFQLEVCDATLQSIAVQPSSATIVAGRSVQLAAMGTFSDAIARPLPTGVSWSVDAGGHAQVSAAGLVTSALPTSPGVAQVTATVGGLTAEAAVTVSPAVVESIAVVSSVEPPYRLPKGLTLQFSAEATLSDGTVQVLAGTGWSVAPVDGSVASVDATGLAAATGLGDAAITYTDAGSGVAGNAALTVIAPIVSSIAVTPSTASKPVGETQQFVATATLSDGSTANVTGAVAWSCPDASPKASVTASGLATGLEVGSATIRATDATTGARGDATLTVLPPALLSVSVSPASSSLAAGRSVQLTATGVFSDGPHALAPEAVAWAASSGAVVLDGRASGRTAGTFTITASYGGKLASATLTVTAAVVDAVAVTPSASIVAPGGTQKFRGEAIRSDGTVSIWPTWTSAPTSVATVGGSTGVVSAVAEGAATITATMGGTSGTATLLVQTPGSGPPLDGSLPWPSSFPRAGSLPSLGAEAYDVSGLTAGARYVATLSGVDGAAGVEVFADAALSQPLCRADAVPGVAAVCIFTAPEGTVYAALDTTVAAPTAYSLDVDPLDLLSAVVWPTWFSMPAVVGSSGIEYRVAGLVPGVSYAVSLVGPTANADLYVYEDAGFQRLACVSAGAGMVAETCDVVAPATGAVYLFVYAGNPAAMVYFDLDVVPSGAARRHVSFPGAVPYAGSVGTGTTVHLVNGLVPGAQYYVSLSNLHFDVNLRVFGDAALEVPLCTSSNAGTTRERCLATATAEGTLFVVADGGGTAGGAAFRLDVTIPGPLGSEYWVLSAPTDLPLNLTSSGGNYLFALTGLAPLTRYTIRVTVSDGDPDLFVYADAARTAELCRATTWASRSDACFATSDAAGSLYVSTSAYLTPPDLKLEAVLTP